jgi:RNA polymerase sigma-70 factor (ECF subfamily)
MIDAIKRGDEFAFEQAYNECRGKVYAYFLKKTKSPEDAMDLLQTAFLKLWKYRKSLSEEYLLDQHLFHISRTVFIDFLRKQSRENKIKHAPAELIAMHTPPYAYISGEFDLKAQLNGVLASMPETRKKVFELHKIYGYSYKEIAEQLSISIKSVDNNLTKALRQIRRVVLLLAAIVIFVF